MATPELEVVLTCPLGSKCEEIKDNKLHRCVWFQQFAGTGPDGKPVDERGCAIPWIPILLIENSHQQLKTTAAAESLREEMGKAQQSNQQVLMAAARLVHDIKQVT